VRYIPKRIYQRLSGELAKSRLKDRDSAADVNRVRALVYASAGGVIGLAAGAFKFGLAGGLVGGALGYAAVYFAVQRLAEGAGRTLGSIYHPSGTSTPYRRQYSEPQSLALRGLFQEAIDCYETYVAEFPEDPEPCIGIARIYRDHLRRYEDAVHWFRRARQATGIQSGQELLVTREIIELYQGKLNQPRSAIPELARLAERFAGTREGGLARAELEQLRRETSEPPAP
jgi:tetratricopeptide (TPR) repeat protein